MIFSELDFRMSVVKRWSVVETIRKQSLAEHSYNVAIMAWRIATRIYAKPDDPGIWEAVQYALFHDKKESVTGDFPSYMKPYVNEEGALQNVPAFNEEEEVDLGSAENPHPLSRFIVKCADYIDACIFLRMEISLGNRSVSHHLRNLEERFRQYVISNDTREVDMPVWTWYNQEIVEGLFGGNGQYVSEIDGFPKSR